MSIPAYAKYIIISLLFIVATVNFTKTTLRVIESSKRLERLRTEVSGLEDEKVNLEGDLEYKKTSDFVVLEARNKLGLVRPGEEVFVVKNVLGAITYKGPIVRDFSEKTNAQQWISLFF